MSLLKQRLQQNAARAAGHVVPLRPAPANTGDEGTEAFLRQLDELAAAPAPAIPDRPTPEQPAQELPAQDAAAIGGLEAGAVDPSDLDKLREVDRCTFMSHEGSGVLKPYREGRNLETGAAVLTPVTEAELRTEFAHRPPVRTFDAGAGRWRRVNVGAAWVAWPHRRTYPAGVGLWPDSDAPEGSYNLWRGFAVAPRAGDPSPMLDHVAMLCGGDGATADYVLNWMAAKVQRPGLRPEVALVFRGGQGTGKGTLARVMLSVFGSHGMHLTNQKHLTGTFNGHLRQALLLFVDEGWWAGSREDGGVLKGLLTEPTLVLEQKHRDAVAGIPNRLAVMMASNSSWVVPAAADERRYCVIDVPGTRAQDHGYFGSLHRWLDDGGNSVFLRHLLDRDLTAFNVRAVPRTAALDRQKIEAMCVMDRWLMDALDSGVHLGGGSSAWADEPAPVSCSLAADAFAAYAQRFSGRAARADSRAIGKRLDEVFGCGRATLSGERTARHRAWVLPGLQDARRRAAAAFGLSCYDWGQA